MKNRRTRAALPLKNVNLMVPASVKSAAGKEEKEKPKQGILRKYWYIIVPVLLLTLLNPGELPAENAAGAKGGSAGAK